MSEAFLCLPSPSKDGHLDLGIYAMAGMNGDMVYRHHTLYRFTGTASMSVHIATCEM